MRDKVLLDVNICLDWLLNRVPFADNAGRIFEAAEENRMTAIVSAISFDTMFYVMRRDISGRRASAELKNLTKHITIGEVNERVIKNALSAGWTDLEDAIQYFSAENAACRAVISRNPTDFNATPALPVFTPVEYISTYL